MADVTNAEDCERMVKETLAAFGKLNVLYCSVGMNHVGTALNTELEEWNRTLAVNLTSVFLCCKYAVPAMATAGGGSITGGGGVHQVNRGCDHA